MNRKNAIAVSCNALAALCVIAAVVLACAGKEGWGWMLFLAYLVYQSPEIEE